MPNQISQLLKSGEALPPAQKEEMLNGIIQHTVKFLKTTNTRIKDMNAHQAEVYLKNEPAVQNHIGGIHAAAMVLLAETATGMVLGVSLPDDKIPLAKSIQVDFKKMTKGDLKAIARMTDAQIKRIQEDEKGEVDVEVKILDSEGLEPLVAKVVWAWIPKKS